MMKLIGIIGQNECRSPLAGLGCECKVLEEECLGLKGEECFGLEEEECLGLEGEECMGLEGEECLGLEGEASCSCEDVGASSWEGIADYQFANLECESFLRRPPAFLLFW